VDQDETSTVVFRLTTDSLGRVVGATIARSSGRLKLDSIALEAIRRSKFRMSTPTQQKSGSSFEYPLKFKPKKKARD